MGMMDDGREAVIAGANRSGRLRSTQLLQAGSRFCEKLVHSTEIPASIATSGRDELYCQLGVVESMEINKEMAGTPLVLQELLLPPPSWAFVDN